LRDSAQKQQREQLLQQAVEQFQNTLQYDSENVAAHYNLAQLHRHLGNESRASEHQRLYEIYKPDDNALGEAIRAARVRYPAANHAAGDVVLYDLHRPGAVGRDAGSNDKVKNHGDTEDTEKKEILNSNFEIRNKL